MTLIPRVGNKLERSCSNCVNFTYLSNGNRRIAYCKIYETEITYASKAKSCPFYEPVSEVSKKAQTTLLRFMQENDDLGV